MQYAFCFPDKVVVFVSQVEVGCHAVMLHQADGHGDVAHRVEELVSTVREFLGERMEEVYMRRMTDVDEDVHSRVLNRIP